MATATEFDVFWAAYPRRHAKIDAMKAYAQARKVATAEEILAGVEVYKRIKPEYADWKLPAGWLRAGRWMDEDDAPVPVPVKVECTHEPRCNSKDWCATMRAREAEGWFRSPDGQWGRRSA